MSYYNFKITNGEKEIMMLDAHEPFYDNVIFWQLTKLIDVIEQGVDDERLFISRVYSDTDYFNLSRVDYEPTTIIDLKTRTVTNPKITCCSNIKELQEYCPYGVTYREQDGKFFAKWDYDEEYEIKKVYFDDESILEKDTLTFEELKELNDFVNYLLNLGDSEFVLPSGSIIRLHLA